MKILIIGGGVGGLTLALSLLNVGIRDIHIYESTSKINELGVGINILPHAMREMERLNLLKDLLSVSVETSELQYFTQNGQFIWKEKRGIGAGYNWPQISIHRGLLIKVLYKAVLERLGSDRIHTNHRLNMFKKNADGSITAVFNKTSQTADCLIGCDGINSVVREQLYPNEGSAKWNGITMWRGVSPVSNNIIGDSIIGKSMIIAGSSEHRIVTYPILKHLNSDDNTLINWVAKHKTAESQAMPNQNWIHEVKQTEIPEYFKNFDFLNFSDLIKNSTAIYKYPEVDRDPLPSWDFGNITLLGDAAHPMYPSGSNGGSQAILDAAFLSQQLLESSSIQKAINNYDNNRRASTSAIVLDNRKSGPEKCIDIVEHRAPNGFAMLNDVISPKELEDISISYKKIAGFEPNMT